MPTKKPYTPRSKIKNALRKLWLQSRERAAARKRDQYTCQMCGKKETRAKGKEFFVEVHHKKGIQNWDHVIDVIYKDLLCNPEDLQCLCKECHLKTEKK